MKSIEAAIADQGAKADPVHLAAAAAGLTALIGGTAERFARLPLEAEPAAFQAELRRSAP
jgi:hypothetical protein